MDMQLLDFESFFHQLIPFNTEDTKLMVNNAINPPPTQEITYEDSKSGINSSSNTPTNSSPNSASNSPSRVEKKSILGKHELENLDDADKQKVRRANQNLACRNYRRRKKEYVHELEGRIQRLEAENEQLRKDSTKRDDSGSDLDPTAASLLLELKQLLERLEDAVKNHLDDKSISYLLQLFFLTVEKRRSLMEKDVEKFVNPLMQAKLATFGYVPATDINTVPSFTGISKTWWETVAVEAGLSEDQKLKVAEIRERHWKADSDMRMERMMLDKQIKDFYYHKLKLQPVPVPNGPPQQLDMGEVIEFARHLSNLKKNLVCGRTLLIDVHSQLSKVLTPRQHAIILVRVNSSRNFDWPRHVQTLKSAWQLFSEGDKTQVLPGGNAAPINHFNPSGNLSFNPHTQHPLSSPIVPTTLGPLGIHPASLSSAPASSVMMLLNNESGIMPPHPPHPGVSNNSPHLQMQNMGHLQNMRSLQNMQQTMQRMQSMQQTMQSPPIPSQTSPPQQNIHSNLQNVQNMHNMQQLNVQPGLQSSLL